MNLSNAEKLILTMLCDVHEALKLKDSVDPKLVREAISSGNLWGLEWEYPGIFEADETSEDVVREIADILDMWSIIEHSHQHLSPEGKAQVEKDAAPFGKNVRFNGFDGNHEGEYYSAARFMIKELKRFDEFAGRDLNSHMQSVPGYRRMLLAFKPIRDSLSSGWLSAEQLVALLNSRRHPAAV